MTEPEWRGFTVTRDPLLPTRSAEHYMVMPVSARRWTVDEVREMQDEERAWPRFELIDGELIVTPSPAIVHQRAIMEIVLLLARYTIEQHVGELLTSPADLELAPGTIVQPDVFVLSERDVMNWREARSLLLAVEVVSPSSRRVDRVTKRRFFSQVDVSEYWVIDPEDRIFERTRGRELRAEILDETIDWMPVGASEPLVIGLPGFFAGIHKEK